MKAKDPSDLERLRARIDDALRRERPRNEVMPLLARLLVSAGESGELFVYAHRHMAELLIADEPWQSALHLRQVIKAGAADDTAHALMGLCQALLGNFDSAVYQYERALVLAPQNAWYHHNLGHLLDVALNRPEEAAKHLRWAHDAHPMEDEVTASLAHCLARIGQLEEAEALAQEAVDLAPDHESHGSLLSWIKRRAPGGFLFSAEHAFHGRDPRYSRGEGKAENDRDVLRALERGMQAGGAPPALLSRAEKVWRDYRARRPRVRVAKPEVHAAALEYAVSVMHGISGVTQTGIAKRYGISSTALASRYTDMRSALELTVGDPRYLR
ncbi:MAG TPA: tetratricopeptide repeat protein [Polyangiales bacterium]